MTKIITSEESDVELDPESLTETTDISENTKIKRLEAIRDLEALLENAESSSNIEYPQLTKEEPKIGCIIRFESLLTKNVFATNVYLTGLNQTVIERNLTEVELHGEEQKLIKLFSFYQNNVYKQKRSRKFGHASTYAKKSCNKKKKEKAFY